MFILRGEKEKSFQVGVLQSVSLEIFTNRGRFLFSSVSMSIMTLYLHSKSEKNVFNSTLQETKNVLQESCKNLGIYKKTKTLKNKKCLPTRLFIDRTKHKHKI